MSPLRVAIAGTGFIGGAHAREAVTILRRDPAKPSPATAREARRVEVAASREPAVDSWAVAT